ncbi:hypothetical protein XM38_046030 [Halomicronema hongdechloris C2206]|uniref:DUF4350 domain-containing protein n=1 Tax=Halomicronema hongdechloris C2206 TaxID=1641165 RepID=A0A1Z3HTP1_9CYAN|nr:DUF4350 domain-containing protein [Halomicronema hongdechloris]ASC73632.1 hypothetical protein XM38_046030 [Halomicronema hongdechloris C2206]
MRQRRLWLLFGMGLLLLLGLLSLSTPSAFSLASGSTWNRNPDGYAAWYDYMEAQGVAIQRWQQPVADLLKQRRDQEPATLVQIHPTFWSVEGSWAQRPWLDDWLRRGNTLVVLGLSYPVTAAPFETQIPSDRGPVTIATRRRQAAEKGTPLLQDDQGLIVWRQPQSAGQLILAVTPHLAANAYQQAAGNFPWLADLVTQAGGPIWVDEYLHGYREAEASATAGASSWLTYLAQTPLVLVCGQIVVICLLIGWAQNRYLGAPQAIHPPVVDNSTAYIQALAEVLYKANSHQFVVDALAAAERQQLQQRLGLGTGPVDDATLATAWHQATGGAATELHPLTPPTSLNTMTLREWLRRLHVLHSRDL